MQYSPVYSTLEFDDFDFFANNIRQGDIMHQKLSTGQFSGSLRQIQGRHVILSIHRMNQLILQQGTTLEGYITFLIPGDMNQDFTWRCNRLKGDVMGVLRGGMEHHCVTHPNFVGMPVSIESEYLQELADAIGCYDIFKIIKEKECFLVDREQSRLIRKEIRRVFVDVSLFDTSWEEYMSTWLVQLITGKDSSEFQADRFRKGMNRRRIYQRAIQYMNERVMDPVSVLEVAEEIGVSERNLRYAFHEVAQMSPKRFFDRLRLNEVRKLLKSGNFQNVIDVSQTFGFWHSGKFASDYRSLFYEYPSQSLKKSIQTQF